MTSLDDALGVLASMVIDDGRRWGDAATEVQWIDAHAVLDVESSTPYHFETRARGYSKTDDAAGLAIAVMLTQAPPMAKCYWLAADRDQGRLAIDSIAGFVARTPELAGALDIDAFRVTVRRTGTTLEVLAADAPSSYGLRPYLLVVDELTVWASTQGPRRLFDATSSALAKVAGARCLVITSAGDPSHWSYQVREHARVDRLWRLHEVDGPPPWIDPERLAEQRRRLLPSMYARLFENRWTTSEDRLTTVDDLAACTVLDGPRDRLPGRRYALGVDIGLKNDRTVVAVCSIAEGDASKRVALDRIAVWQGSRRSPVSLDVVEAWIGQAHRDYGQPWVVCDPYQAAQLMQRLATRGVHVVEHAFTAQSVSRLALRLYQLIQDHALELPEDAELLAELANVRLREPTPGVYRLDHDADKHDDRAIAVALAAAHLVEQPSYTTTTSLLGEPMMTADLMDMEF